MRNPVGRFVLAYLFGYILFFILLIVGVKACGQKYEWKKNMPSAALVFAAGMFEGAMDHLQFHYDRPNQFWNPDISWRNKYKGGDPANGKTFAGKYMVWTTDGWHMMKAGRNVSLFTGFVLHISQTSIKKRWYWCVLEGLGYWTINRVGFNLTYNLLLR